MTSWKEEDWFDRAWLRFLLLTFRVAVYAATFLVGSAFLGGLAWAVHTIIVRIS